jgi:hypothetical protein
VGGKREPDGELYDEDDPYDRVSRLEDRAETPHHVDHEEHDPRETEHQHRYLEPVLNLVEDLAPLLVNDLAFDALYALYRRLSTALLLHAHAPSPIQLRPLQPHQV